MATFAAKYVSEEKMKEDQVGTGNWRIQEAEIEGKLSIQSTSICSGNECGPR